MEQVETDGRDATRDVAVERLRDLATALAARGLTVRPEPERWSLVAINKAAEPDNPRDPLAVAYGPVKLVQRVQLAPLPDDGALWWWWLWSGATRDAPGEVEPLCPADAVAEACERVSRVLALAGQ